MGVELTASRIEHDRLIIASAGPAASTAAIYAARSAQQLAIDLIPSFISKNGIPSLGQSLP
jgi:hypothetical protein